MDSLYQIDSIYYHEKYHFGVKDIIGSAIITIIGAVLMLIFRNSDYGFLIGLLVISIGNLALSVQGISRQ